MRVEPEAAEDLSTETLPFAAATSPPGTVRRFRLTVLEGPEPGRSRDSRENRVSIGHHALNDLVLKDATVSRFHCEVWIDGGRARIRDLGSRNGTMVDGVGITEAFLRDGSKLRLGPGLISFRGGGKKNKAKPARPTQLGAPGGRAAAVRP